MCVSSKSAQVVHCSIMPNISQEPLKPWSIKHQKHEIYDISFYSAITGQEKYCLGLENLRILLNTGLQSAINNPVKPIPILPPLSSIHWDKQPLPHPLRLTSGRQVWSTHHAQTKLSNLATSAGLQHSSRQCTTENGLLARNQVVSLWGPP